MSDIGPIYTGRPRAVSAYNNKYSNPSPFVSGLGNPTLRALKRMDAARANTGQSPLTAKETRVAGTAAESHQTAPELKADQPWWKDAIGDITSIVGEIPKVPISIYREGTKLPHIGDEWNKAVEASGAPSNPLETLGAFAQLPGVRLAPGAFVASQFAPGGQGIGGLTEHPVFTALDVLPYAEKGASLTPTFKAAQDAAAATAALQKTLPARVTPIGANLRSFPHRTTTMQPSPVTAGIDVPTMTPNLLFRGTTAAQRLIPAGMRNTAAEAFGKAARNTSRVEQRIAGEMGLTTADNPLPPYTSPMARVAAEGKQVGAPELAVMQEALGPERTVSAIKAMTTGDPTLLPALDDEQRALIAKQQELNVPFAEQAVRDGELAKLKINGVEDYYTPRTAKGVERARRLADQQIAVQYLRDSLNPKSISKGDPAVLLEHMRTAMADKALSVTKRTSLARGYLAALDDAGFDVREAGQTLNRPSAAKLNALADSIPESPSRAGATTKTRAASRFKALSQLEDQKFTPGRMRQAIKRRDLVEAGAVPTKFEPAIRQAFETKLRGAAEQKFASQPDLLEEALGYLDREVPGYPELHAAMPEEFKAAKTEARMMTQQLRDAGVEPTFRHIVHPDRARQYQFAQINSRVNDLKQFKSRMFDPQPSISNLAVELDHRASEILLREGRKYFVSDHLVPLESRTTMYLRQTLQGAAEAAGKDVSQIMERDWHRFDVNSYINTGRVGQAAETAASDLWIPKTTWKNLERLSATPSDLARGAEKALKPFRTSVVSLSPRLHVGNTVGGAIMVEARAHNPLGIIKNFSKAIKMVRDHTLERMALDQSLSPEARETARLLPSGQHQALQYGEDLAREITSSKSPRAAMEKSYATLGGAKMAKWIDAGSGAWDSAVGKFVRQGFNKVTARSMWLNETTDNMMRALSYLDEYDHAVRKGATAEEALTKGIQAVRNTLQNFDTMTPLERTTMRYLVPFWSWARTALRYTMTYPGDHPWRVSILSSLARAEAEDWNTGLPQYMKNWLFLGDTKTDGTVKAINLDGINPFKDVSNYFTLGGFLGAGEGGAAGITAQVNPLIATALQQFGVDTMGGEAELFPEVSYNQNTGRLEAKPKETFGKSLVGNLLPQARFLMAISGQSNQYKEMMKRDPASAGRFLFSSIGLPSTLPRDVDVPTETMKAELTRYSAYKTDVKNQLKAGNVGGLIDKYPGLGAFRSRLEALTPQSMAKYSPASGMAGSYNPGYGELFKAAVGAGG